MNSTAQHLLRKLLDQAGGPAEAGFVLVLEGQGLEDLPADLTTSKSTYAVRRPQTEIGLRHILWQADGAPVIAVLPQDLAARLPLDILRRASNQRVHALAINDVLSVVLGVRVVGAEAKHLEALAIDNVDRLGDALSQRTLPTVIDRRLLTDLLLEVTVGEGFAKATPGKLLAGWVKEPPHWPEDMRQLVLDALPTKHGDEGRLLAWALSAPEGLDMLIVHGALLSVDRDKVPQQAWGPLWQAAKEPPIEMDRGVLRVVACGLVEAALVLLGDAAGPLLEHADAIGRRVLTPEELKTSRVLPLALADRCTDLARRAAAGQEIAGADLTWIRSHLAAPSWQPEIAVLEQMARLSRYLASPELEGPDVLALVRQYQTGGAFADVAARALRRALAGATRFNAEAQKLLAAYRLRRDRENAVFARALAHDYESALHHQGIVPLHRVWKRTVAPVWQDDGAARLYVAVLDGCSYPVFLEIVAELARAGTHPLGLRADAAGQVAGVPALAPLPTVTSHARGALFLGELPSDPLVAETVFCDQAEAKTDKARFKQNAALGPRSRQLFLKGDLADGGVSLLAALADPDVHVVAAVFNAVDDQIGSSNTGAQVRVSPLDIAGFVPSLQEALRSGRQVLLTADHGHTPFLDTACRVGAGSSPRFVELEPGGAVPAGFAEIDLKGLGGVPARRAFAWKGGAYYGNPQVGFHGGCSLEEMVVPLAWIVRDGLTADEPPWWYGTGAMPPPAYASAAAHIPSQDTTPPVPPAGASHGSGPAPKAVQPALFEPATRAAQLDLPEGLLDELSDDEKAILVLLRENGTARTSELADRLGKNPMRINGLIVRLRRTLVQAESLCFSDEPLPSGETLYRFVPPGGAP